MTFYWITNAISIVLILILFTGSWWWSRPYKNFSTLNITLIAVLVALSIVFTNLIGYNLKVFGIQISLGNFIIFIIGMLLGPLAGVVGGLVSDSVGSLINISGSYHVNFLLAKILFGFFGACVFMGKRNRFWSFRVFGLLSFVCALQILVLNPIGLWSMNGWKAVWVTIIPTLPKKAITWVIQSSIYPTLTVTSFKVLWQLYKKSSYASTAVWALKNESFEPQVKRKSLQPNFSEVKIPNKATPKVNDKVEKI